MIKSQTIINDHKPPTCISNFKIKELIFLKHPTIRAAMARVEVENPKIKEARGIPWGPSPLKAAFTMKTGAHLQLWSCDDWVEDCQLQWYLVKSEATKIIFKGSIEYLRKDLHPNVQRWKMINKDERCVILADFCPHQMQVRVCSKRHNNDSWTKAAQSQRLAYCLRATRKLHSWWNLWH